MVIRILPRAALTFLTGIAFLSRIEAEPALKDDVAPDAASLSTQMEAFTTARAAQKKLFFENASQKLEAAMKQNGNAGNYALGCMRQLRFGDVKGGNLEAAKWKKDNAKLLSDRDLDRAADLHLHYLDLTLKRAEKDSSAPLVKDVWAYLAELYKAPDLLSQVKAPGKPKRDAPDDPRSYINELLGGPVTSGWVACSLGLDGHFGTMQNWETSAGNFSGILDQDIRPVLRDAKDPALISTWDYEIGFQELVANQDPDRKVLATFQQEAMPRLLWKKADDVEKLGMPNKALEMRIALAKTYPAHPDFESWTGTIMAALDKLKKSSSGNSEESGGQIAPTVQSPPAS
jgi:hypothetical protein